MNGDQQIEGLPQGAELRPLGGAAAEDIEGLPAGAELRPIKEAPEPNLPGATPRLKAAVKAGALSFPETEFEKQRRPENQPTFMQSWLPGVFPPPTEVKRRQAALAPAVERGYATGEDIASEKNLTHAPEFHPVENMQSRAEHGRSLPYQGVAALGDVLPFGIEPREQEEAADIGNKRGVLGSAAQSLTWNLAPAVAEGAGLARAGVNRALEPARFRNAPENILTALDTPAGKRGTRAAQIKEDVRVATKDLAEIEKQAPAKVTWLLKRGKGAENFHDLAEKIDARQDAMWEEGHKPGIERHGEMPINEDRVAATGQRAMTRMAARSNPQEAEGAARWLTEQRKPTTLREADELIRYINDDLKAKGAETRYGPLAVSVRQAVVKALRQEVESALERSGEKGVLALNRRWGALENIKGRLREQAVGEARKEAKGGILPDWVHLYTFMHPGFGMSMGMSVAAAKALRTNPATRLTRGLRQLGRTSAEAPFGAEPPAGWREGPETNPARLLPPPATRLPAPGSAETLHPEMFPQEPMAREPASNVQRGAGGRMQRVYEGVNKEPGGQARLADMFSGELGPTPAKRPPAPQAVARPEEQRLEMNQLRVAPGAERRAAPPAEAKPESATRDALVKAINKVLNNPLATAKEKAAARTHLNDIQAGARARGQAGAREKGVKGSKIEESEWGDQFAKTFDPSEVSAYFIHQDGRALGPGDAHMQILPDDYAIQWEDDEGDSNGSKIQEKFMKETGATRIFSTEKGLNVESSGPLTESQLSNINKVAKQHQLKIYYDVNGKHGEAETPGDFIRAIKPERRVSVRDIKGPDFMRTANAQQLRGQLADPSLPDRDRAIIQAQLADLIAHPFERTEKLDINKVRTAQKKGKQR